MDIKGKKVIVTGGAAGIGQSIVEKLLNKNAIVGVFNKPNKSFTKSNNKSNVYHYICDVSNPAQVRIDYSASDVASALISSIAKSISTATSAMSSAVTSAATSAASGAAGSNVHEPCVVITTSAPPMKLIWTLNRAHSSCSFFILDYSFFVV